LKYRKMAEMTRKISCLSGAPGDAKRLEGAMSGEKARPACPKMFPARAGTMPIDVRSPRMDRFAFAIVQKSPGFPLAGLQNFVLKNAK
jgi:hypothetical protein